MTGRALSGAGRHVRARQSTPELLAAVPPAEEHNNRCGGGASGDLGWRQPGMVDDPTLACMFPLFFLWQMLLLVLQ